MPVETERNEKEEEAEHECELNNGKMRKLLNNTETLKKNKNMKVPVNIQTKMNMQKCIAANRMLNMNLNNGRNGKMNMNKEKVKMMRNVEMNPHDCEVHP
jgi:hypothetical protein